jgi:hypothetical protein
VIEPGHPDADDPLLLALVRALEQLGARVRIDRDADNLVRRLAPPSPWLAEVESQGLPNLLHEAVHIVLAGRLDDDHGIDYGAIPFDLEQPAGRRVLWEELAACAVSCAYLERPRDGERPADVAARVAAWFREQLDIQPVFYGMDDDPPGFWHRTRALAAAHADELAATLDEAHAKLEALLLAGGAAPERACARRLDLDAVWDRAARRHAA